jgi:hypothetical protein
LAEDRDLVTSSTWLILFVLLVDIFFILKKSRYFRDVE